jgi:hypothetical protein
MCACCKGHGKSHEKGYKDSFHIWMNKTCGALHHTYDATKLGKIYTFALVFNGNEIK